MAVKARLGLPLSQYESSRYSQFGEDGVLRYILGKIPHERFVIDVGAWDGTHLSNTRQFIDMGYRALLIEADPQKALSATVTFQDNDMVSIINEMVDPSSWPLSSVFAANNVPLTPGLISIDIDGLDYLVMQSLGPYLPTVVVVEFNPTIPNHITYVQTNIRRRIGNSASALKELAANRGYALVHAVGVNLIFVEEKVALTTGLPSLSIEDALDDSETIRAIWTSYDGRVHFEGASSIEFPWNNYRRPILSTSLPNVFDVKSANKFVAYLPAALGDWRFGLRQVRNRIASLRRRILP